MDTGKATWDSCGIDHGTLASVHGAKHFNVGLYHMWLQDIYSMTMVLADVNSLFTMDTCGVSIGCA
jgi:hypothetical protein